MVKKKCIFLDRDGVLNRSIIRKNKAYAPTNINQFYFFPKVKMAIKKLQKKFKLVIISNQPDVGKKKIKLQEIKKMNNKITSELKINDIYYCFHKQSQSCKCRKPNTLLFIKAIKKFNIDVKKSYMIGDRKSDIDAGINIGCKTVFIERKYNEKKPNNYTFLAKNLHHATERILRKL